MATVKTANLTIATTPIGETFNPTTNTIVATMTNSDFDSDSSSVNSFVFTATTDSTFSNSICN